MSVADARLKIEEEFEHNFKPDRDLVEFLQYKQQSLIDREAIIAIKPSTSSSKTRMKTSITQKSERRRSNVRMRNLD